MNPRSARPRSQGAASARTGHQSRRSSRIATRRSSRRGQCGLDSDPAATYSSVSCSAWPPRQPHPSPSRGTRIRRTGPDRAARGPDLVAAAPTLGEVAIHEATTLQSATAHCFAGGHASVPAEPAYCAKLARSHVRLPFSGRRAQSARSANRVAGGMILGVRGALTVEFRLDLAPGSAPLRSAEPLPVQAGPGLEPSKTRSAARRLPFGWSCW